MANPGDVFDLEQALAEILLAVQGRLDELAHGAPGELAAVILGGGYGRGEGGIFTAPDGTKRLYNDLDFFVFVRARLPRSRCRWWRDALKKVDDELTPRYGVEVEFGPPTGVDELEKLTPTLMYQELIRGMRPVWGACMAVRNRIAELDWWKLPASEGARLLLNRGAGLLLGVRRMEAGSMAHDIAGRDFVVRNIHKAALAVGDGWLLARGLYRFGLAERAELLRHDPEFPHGALADYEAAIRFKFAPFADPAPDLDERWLRGTAAYLNAVADYEQLNPPSAPPGLLEPLKNIIRHWQAGLDGKWSDWTKHPRCRLQTILSGLLVDKMAKRQYISNIGMDSELTPVSPGGCRTGSGREELFLRGWRRFN